MFRVPVRLGGGFGARPSAVPRHRRPENQDENPVSPIASYRHLLRLAGPFYVVIAFVGRLPLAMSQMGALLLVSGTTGSYAAGGLAAGALAVANALCSPVAAV